MRKYIFLLGIVMLCLLIVQIQPSYGLEMSKEVPLNVSSKDFLKVVEEQNIQNIAKICTDDFCDYLRGLNIEDSFSLFVQKYQDYLTEIYSEERALEVVLKGFPITKIEILN